MALAGARALDCRGGMADGTHEATMTEGGTEWEIRTAGDQLIAAWRANDPEGMALALIRFSEGLRNVSLGVVGQVLIPVAGQIKDLAEIVTNARQADLNWRTEERTTRDAQSDRLYTELDRLVAASEEAARGLGGLRKDIDQLRTEQGGQAAQLDALQAGQLTYNDRLDSMDARHNGQWEEAMSLLAESKADREDLRHRIEARREEREAEHQRTRAELAELRAALAKLKANGDGVRE